MSAAQTSGRTLPGFIRRATRHDPLVIAAGVALAVVAVIALVGPVVAPYDPDAPLVGAPHSPISPQHWLGTDAIGRDILSRLLSGAPVSVLPPLAVAVAATAIGATIGVVGAWFGGTLDWLLTRVIDVIFAIPGLVLAILAVAMYGKGIVAPSLALIVASLPLTARLIRASARVELGKPYFESLHVQGAGRLRIWARHLTPALAPTIVAQATIGFAYAMLDLAAISYLGLGLQPPAADWGSMIASGQASILEGHPMQSLSAAALVLITVLSMSVLGARMTAWAEGTGR